MDDGYEVGAVITGTLLFLGIWGYCTAEFGFLGFALGWMPALILAWLGAFIWPLIALLVILAIGLAFIVIVGKF